MNNINISFSNNQEKNKYYKNLLVWMSGSLIESVDSSFYVGKRFTENSRNILTIVIRYCALFQTNYISHARIAQLANVHHDTVLKTLHMFAQLGIIKIVSRGANKTCIYELSSFLHDQSVIWELKEIIPNLYWGIQTIIRRCRATIQVLVGHWKVTQKSNTARLLNNKIKRILYKKENHEIITHKNPIQPILVQNDRTSDYHSLLFSQFADILDGKGAIYDF